MHHTTRNPLLRTLGQWGLLLTVLLALVGHAPAGLAGWHTHPPVCSVILVLPGRRRRRRRGAPPPPNWAGARAVARATARRSLIHTLVLAVVLLACPLPPWCGGLLSIPLLRWLLRCGHVALPRWCPARLWRALDGGLCRLHQGGLLGGVLLLCAAATERDILAALCSGLVLPAVEGRVRDDGTWEITLGKDLVIRHRPVDDFDARMFLLFLRTIYLPDAPYKPPRTQPLLRQEWLASWFGVLQEEISRWQTYQRRGDWRRLMSRRAGNVVPLEQQQAIIQQWARHPWWDVATATAQCRAQGLDVRPHQVEQVGHESGLLLIRQVLRERYHLDATQFRPKDAYLVQRQGALIATLQAHVEAGTALPPEQQAHCADLARLRDEVGIGPSPAADASPPWGSRMQQVLLGQTERVDEDAIRCPHCGTTAVRRKSRQPRMKRFLDDQGQEQQVAVYRYYCTNSDCPHQTFTHLPPDLLPYSRHRAQLRTGALQAYELGRGTYRSTARALGISTATAYRWLTAGGSALLPVAQLFGVVRSSGVVGIDEKWVKVPHNDKPPGKHRRWMYVYTAVDVWTYDLLHIAIAPHLGQDSARVFMQELRAKGYRPQVIVTDLSQDYPAAITQVFPHAEHHLCVFHALKTWQRTLREVYGKAYRERHPAATTLHRQLVQLCRARTKRTAQRRAAAIHALRADYVAADPDVAAVFDSLERHWPKLVNAIESRRIPLTNNATELVNRRFDQHYQNFCGFQTIETAQRYLAIFERTYRLTPFTADAQPRVRGTCPLELAGYDVSAIPLARLLAAQPPDNGSDPPGAGGVPTA